MARAKVTAFFRQKTTDLLNTPFAWVSCFSAENKITWTEKKDHKISNIETENVKSSLMQWMVESFLPKCSTNSIEPNALQSQNNMLRIIIVAFVLAAVWQVDNKNVCSPTQNYVQLFIAFFLVSIKSQVSCILTKENHCCREAGETMPFSQRGSITQYTWWKITQHFFFISRFAMHALLPSKCK